MKQYKINDRVSHEYLGDGIIINVIGYFYNSKVAQFYIVLFDNAPDVRYNGGNKQCLVFPSDIK